MAEHPIDHLMWGCADLDQGIEVIRSQLGVAPVPGGPHPSLGTTNALVALGLQTYLEVLAPDPLQQTKQSSLPEMAQSLAALKVPGLVTWAVACTDLPGLAECARGLGLNVRGPVATKRETPSGETLTWELLFLGGHGYGGLMPFFIDWGNTAHPARTNPQGGQFQQITLMTTDAQRLESLLSGLSVTAKIEQAERPLLVVELETLGGLATELKSTPASLALMA